MPCVRDAVDLLEVLAVDLPPASGIKPLVQFIDYHLLLSFCCMQEYPSIIVVGHSLGGGVASIIALLLRTYFRDCTSGRDVQCFAFSPPGCVFRYLRMYIM